MYIRYYSFNYCIIISRTIHHIHLLITILIYASLFVYLFVQYGILPFKASVGLLSETSFQCGYNAYMMNSVSFQINMHTVCTVMHIIAEQSVIRKAIGIGIKAMEPFKNTFMHAPEYEYSIRNECICVCICLLNDFINTE